MMRRSFLGIAVALTLLLVAAARPAEAQGLASLAAAAGSSMAVEKVPSCWTCQALPQNMPSICVAGSGSGSHAKCGPSWNGGCLVSQPCGSSALLPIDLDGASQYVSRGSRLGMPVVLKEGDPDVRRNCQGVVVARFQTPDAIAQVRSSTGTLTL